MPQNTIEYPTITTRSGRELATYPAGVVIFVVDQQERVLILSHPKSNNMWEPPNGAMDANETPLAAAIRELAEEAGSKVHARPLGVCHTMAFAYDPGAPLMFSISFVFAYESGPVEPDDDMRGSLVKWATIDEIESEAINILVPRNAPWLYHRAVECYRMWKDAPPVQLQHEIDATSARPKYITD